MVAASGPIGAWARIPLLVSALAIAIGSSSAQTAPLPEVPRWLPAALRDSLDQRRDALHSRSAALVAKGPSFTARCGSVPAEEDTRIAACAAKQDSLGVEAAAISADKRVFRLGLDSILIARRAQAGKVPARCLTLGSPYTDGSLTFFPFGNACGEMHRAFACLEPRSGGYSPLGVDVPAHGGANIVTAAQAADGAKFTWLEDKSPKCGGNDDDAVEVDVHGGPVAEPHAGVIAASGLRRLPRAVP